MQKTFFDIKHRLLSALDDEYNVTDMSTVFEVISTLEQLPVTTEVLEATRIGKMVNELRRKTVDKQLAKRAKELVQRWRNLMINSAQVIQQAKLPSSQPNGMLSNHSKRPMTSPDQYTAPLKKPKLNGMPSLNSTIKSPPVEKTPESVPSPVNEPSPEPDPILEPQGPKKRGRKKGGKNSSKLGIKPTNPVDLERMVSVGASKLKTTQEIIASLRKDDENYQLEEKPLIPVQEFQDEPSITKVDKPSRPKVADIDRQIQEIYNRLPPLDLEAIDWSSPPPSPPRPPLSPTDLVDGAQIEGVTGNWENSETFKEWHEVLTRANDTGEPLVILPYVIID
ncbi:PREDICTED: mediator of RNA polymerase II transcription subunit 26-like [Diuraphis noxia]|uniref:mediator of RNA polymerase II transcription subunit 26-like n=1 Tax=Diuraphis noxia TaxID=143948 RepID=UPI000763A0A2|nr:PREDICTED: mediator of RNA polymerase II transcription subunit 26-like [Diuraphis noxia]